MSSPISVIIAAKNAAETLPAQLEALVSQPWPNGGEIIVSDNGSTDRTAEVVQEFTGSSPVSVTVIDCRDVVGAAHARNRGVAASRHQYIGFCDADDVVDPNWVHQLTHALDEHDAVGGRLDIEVLNPPWAARSRGGPLDADSLPMFDNVFPVLSSCNLGIRRETFLDVGGFDESFVRGQDAELSLRLFEAGADTSFAPRAIVNYRLRTNTHDIYSQARGWGLIQHRLRTRLGHSPRLGSTVKSWLWLVANLHQLAHRSGRAHWVYVAGIRVGVLRAQLMAPPEDRL